MWGFESSIPSQLGRIRLAAQDTSLSRRRSGVRIPYALSASTLGPRAVGVRCLSRERVTARGTAGLIPIAARQSPFPPLLAGAATRPYGPECNPPRPAGNGGQRDRLDHPQQPAG